MYKDVIEFLCDAEIPYIENEILSRHTTFRIGGAADLYVIPENADDLKDVYDLALRNGHKVYILGRGSNVVFSDDGYKGIVISTEKLSSVRVEGNTLYAESGASFTHIAAVARDAGLSGLEFAYGIPGSVGGAVYMNAGAYGGQVSDCLSVSTAFDPDLNRVILTKGDDHEFGYRSSIYKMNPKRMILSAEFELVFDKYDSIKARMDDYMGRRRDKQPLEFPSAGSVFKRPEGHFVGQMVEELGLKGYSVGGTQVSEKHAGFIINRGGATASDVEGLIGYIKERVNEAYGVMLECEVIFVK